MKGDRNQTCFRTQCDNTPAVCWNPSTQKFYCVACAVLINEHTPHLLQIPTLYKKFGIDSQPRLYFGPKGMWHSMDGKRLTYGQMSSHHMMNAILWLFNCLLGQRREKPDRVDQLTTDYLVEKLADLGKEASMRGLRVPWGQRPPSPEQFNNPVTKYGFYVNMAGGVHHLLYTTFEDAQDAYRVFVNNVELRCNTVSEIQPVHIAGPVPNQEKLNDDEVDYNPTAG